MKLSKVLLSSNFNDLLNGCGFLDYGGECWVDICVPHNDHGTCYMIDQCGLDNSDCQFNDVCNAADYSGGCEVSDNCTVFDDDHCWGNDKGGASYCNMNDKGCSGNDNCTIDACFSDSVICGLPGD